MNAEGLKQSVAAAQAELGVLKDSLRDRGIKYFARPLGIGLIAVMVSHHAVYKSSQASLAAVRAELVATQTTAQFSSDYMDLRARLAGLYRRLPDSKDPGQWLLDAVRNSLREEGIVPTSFTTPTERSSEGYRFISITVSCVASYKEVASWVARLERGKSMLLVSDLSMDKENASIGRNKVTVTVATVVPTQRETL